MRIHILQRGSIRDPDIIRLRDEYLKRFRRFGRLEISEKKKLTWPKRLRRVLLDEHGATPDSRRFSELIQKWSSSQDGVAFALGDAYGHEDTFAAEADERIALGPMTLPHQLAHLILVEQCYRAATIANGLPYHHD
jgi:23S rRNA (pseudouridine1915-N3)-methyltransferase